MSTVKLIQMAGSLLMVILAACSGITEPGERVRQPAIIQFYNHEVRVEAPDNAAPNEEVVVAVTSYGSGCTEVADTEVLIQDMTAVIRPFSYQTIPGQSSACPSDLRTFQHTVTVRFLTRGVGRIEVRGIAQPSGEEVTFEQAITIE